MNTLLWKKSDKMIIDTQLFAFPTIAYTVDSIWPQSVIFFKSIIISITTLELWPKILMKAQLSPCG